LNDIDKGLSQSQLRQAVSFDDINKGSSQPPPLQAVGVDDFVKTGNVTLLPIHNRQTSPNRA